MNKIDLIRAEFPKQFSLKWEELTGSEEGRVEHGNLLYRGRPTHCRSTIFCLAKMLSINSMLELGSWHFQSSNMAALAMDEMSRDETSWVDSYDIIPGGFSMDYIPPTNPRVRPHYVYPHHSDYDLWKYREKIVYPEFRNMTDNDIFAKNLDILMGNKPDGGYELLLIDADHSKKGASLDLEYCKRVAKSGAVFVVDDLYESRLTEVREFFDELPYEKYDWCDWNDNRDNPLISMGVFIID